MSLATMLMLIRPDASIFGINFLINFLLMITKRNHFWVRGVLVVVGTAHIAPVIARSDLIVAKVVVTHI